MKLAVGKSFVSPLLIIKFSETELELRLSPSLILTPESIKSNRFRKLILLEHKPLLACIGFVTRQKWLVSTNLNLRKRLNLIDSGVEIWDVADRGENLSLARDWSRRARLVRSTPRRRWLIIPGLRIDLSGATNRSGRRIDSCRAANQFIESH